MEVVKKLETTLAGWYKNAPHLPAGGRAWLSANVWWIILIGVIAGVLGMLAALQALWWAQQVTNQYLSTFYDAGLRNSGMYMTAAWVNVAFSVAAVVLEAMAISPLKLRQKKGWNLLFMAMLVNAVGAVVYAVLTISVGSLVGSAIGLAIGGYFLFEIHSSYSVTHKPQEAKKVAASSKSTE